MVIWFAVASVLLVAIVFRSPGIDYRSVIVGSLLPGVEVLFGGPRVLHSVLGAVLLLVVVDTIDADTSPASVAGTVDLAAGTPGLTTVN